MKQEVLSQEWIDENKVARINDVRKMTTSDVVPVDNLQNLLVPKQELPVIPRHVADWIEGLKSKEIDLLENIYDFTHDEDIYNYIREQGNALMRAWLDGYEVEEEQKYYVLDSDDIPLLERVDNQAQKTITRLSIYEKGRDTSRFELTEQEIKDYDERFWAFAEPIEQVDFRLSF